MSTPSLTRYEGDTDTREHAGCLITVTWHHDYDTGPPWTEFEDHGVVIECRSWDSPGLDPTMLRLSLIGRNTNDWYYDLVSSRERARKEGWGLAPDALDALKARLGYEPKRIDILEAAVQADYEHLRGYCHDEWCWLYAQTTVAARTSHGDYFLQDTDGLCGIASTGAADHLDEFFETATAWIDENQAAIQAIARSFEETEGLRSALIPCLR